MFGPFGILYIRAPQAPSNEFSPAKQVVPEVTDPWNQVIQINNAQVGIIDLNYNFQTNF